MQFGNLKGAEVNASATSKFVFYDLDGQPWVTVRHAGETNKPYFNAMLKANAAAARGKRGQSITVDDVVRNRTRDRALYPDHVIVGPWGGWTDGDGKEIAFTPENSKDLALQLPNAQFDDLRAYCVADYNFRTDVVSAEDAEDTAGNS